jgi:ABC-type transport system substrate-binding protein
MTIRRILILAPTILAAFLIQSYFWVPSYEEQTRGNPARLTEYITASSGDASLLNPALSADSASSQIESLVFQGLIDRDKDLRFRGRIAKSWHISEEALFYVNEEAAIPGVGTLDAPNLLRFLERSRKSPPAINKLRECLSHIQRISLLPPKDYSVTREEKTNEEEEKSRKIRFDIHAPARIRLTLDRVDQDLFRTLQALLGPDYFRSFEPTAFVKAVDNPNEQNLSKYAHELLPATEHNPVIVFHLRPGIRFQDGHPLTAKDVKFTYEVIMDPKNLSPRISDYEPVKNVEVVDPLTVKITYKRLYSPALSTWGIGILPEHLLNKKAMRAEAIGRGENPDTFSVRKSNFNRHPVGSGPFRFKEWKSDQFISLRRFNDYWEGPPNYKWYDFRIIPDILTQEMEFYAGTLDSYDVQPQQVQRLKSDPKYQSFSGVSFGYTYIGYNMRRKPFDDVRVRRALGMAIDVNQIIKYVLYGQGERITGPFVKQTEYYNKKVKPLPYDPAGALKLLADAGWRRGKDGWLEKNGKRLQFTLITNSGNDLRKEILAIAQNSWRQIGIDVATDILEWSVFIQDRVNKHDFDALILGWQMGIEPDLYQIFDSSQTHRYQLNFVGFKNKEADDLIVKIRREYNFKKRVEYCHKLHEIIARDQPYTFLYVSKWTAVLDKRIVIKEVDKNGHVYYRKIEPTKTGDYTYYFDKWIKLPEVPNFAQQG